MPAGLETHSLNVDPTVDPVILAVMFAAFLIGAVGPFALCVLGSIRDERAMRRYAAAAQAAESVVISNPVDPSIVPAASTLPVATMPAPQTAANDPAPAEPANDQVAAEPARAIRT